MQCPSRLGIEALVLCTERVDTFCEGICRCPFVIIHSWEIRCQQGRFNAFWKVSRFCQALVAICRVSGNVKHTFPACFWAAA